MVSPDNESGENHRELLRWAQLTCAGELSALVAHDINNAVTGVISYTELAQFGLPSWSEVGDYLEKTLEQARRISALANQLLTLSHEAQPYPTTQPLSESLEAACALVRRRLEKDGIVFEQRLEMGGARITADASSLLLTWLGLLFVARSILLEGSAADPKHLLVIGKVAPEGGPLQARIEIVATGCDLPHFAPLDGTAGCPEGGAPRRAALLFDAARTHVEDFHGNLQLASDNGRLAFVIQAPVVL